MQLDGSPSPARRERCACCKLSVEDNVIPQARRDPDKEAYCQDPEPQLNHDLRRDHKGDERDHTQTHQTREDQQQFKHERDCTGILL